MGQSGDGENGPDPWITRRFVYLFCFKAISCCSDLRGEVRSYRAVCPPWT